MCQHLIAVRFDDDTILYSQSDSTCNINARLYRNDHIFCKYRIGFCIGYWFFVNLKTYAMTITMIKFLGISMFFDIITTYCISSLPVIPARTAATPRFVLLKLYYTASFCNSEAGPHYNSSSHIGMITFI